MEWHSRIHVIPDNRSDYAEPFGDLMFVAPESAHDFDKFSSILEASFTSGVLVKATSRSPLTRPPKQVAFQTAPFTFRTGGRLHKPIIGQQKHSSNHLDRSTVPFPPYVNSQHFTARVTSTSCAPPTLGSVRALPLSTLPVSRSVLGVAFTGRCAGGVYYQGACTCPFP